jgi:hypothetical protein
MRRSYPKPSITVLLVFLLSATARIEAPQLVAYSPASMYGNTSSDVTMYVSPSTTVAEANQNFSIDIRISNVIDLYAWEFKLKWNPTVLEFLSINEGSFLKTHNDTLFVTDSNNTEGNMRVTCLLIGDITGVNGSGILVQIEFQFEHGKESILDLYDTKLVNSLEQSIDHIALDGNVHVEGTSDIAITNVMPLKTVVSKGYPVNMNVTAENQGNFTETFSITIYANTTAIALITNIHLASGNATTITLACDTADTPKGNYTISAYAHPLSNEVDVADNTYVDGIITVIWPYDVTDDGYVGIDDIVAVAEHFGQDLTQPEWDSKYDMSLDGYVGIDDIVSVAEHFGESA